MAADQATTDQMISVLLAKTLHRLTTVMRSCDQIPEPLWDDAFELLDTLIETMPVKGGTSTTLTLLRPTAVVSAVTDRQKEEPTIMLTMLRPLGLIATLAAVVVCVIAAPVSAGNGNGHGKMLSPDQAQVLASTPGTGGSTTERVSPQTAINASQQPGAIVEGLVSTTAAAYNACWSYHVWWGWGTWPYDQHIDDYTYYCAQYGQYIAWRSTTVQAHGTLCGVDWTNSPLISGGAGYSWFVEQATAGFSCPTVVPWLTIHRTDWVQTAYNVWGNASIVATSG